MAAKRRKNSKKTGYNEWARRARSFLSVLVPKSKLGRIVAGLVYGGMTAMFVGMYIIARWYIVTNQDIPLQVGTTFVPNYARYLGVDPKETFNAIINDLNIDRVRLVSYWRDIEPVEGTYNFDELDWQFEMAEKHGTKISLAIGMRQPRWPECHEPDWIDASQPRAEWQPALEKFITAVIERYKDSPSLDSYQLENEYFLSVFGECKNFERQRLVEEYDLVKRLDPDTKVIITRSNNWTIASGFPTGDPRPDEFGVSVYKRVWDATITRRYYEYPIPPWFYSTLAGGGKILTDRDLMIHELQAEAWTPNGYEIKDAPVDELYKSMNPDRLKDRIKYAADTGMRTIDTWGAEWWYQMKVNRGEPGLWQTAKDEIAYWKAHKN
ncbi:beta-galactosidase [Candidatus Saccharibacteria bacterium]|nr:beta-galactosidase [Candidatus Saccharibacteria bacterium]